MKNVYTKLELQEPGFFQKLFGNLPKENAIIELQNLLASKEILQIQPAEVIDLASKYKIDFKEEFGADLKNFYTWYLKKCLEDQLLNDQEVKELNQLRLLLFLSVQEAIEMQYTLALEIFKKEYASAAEGNEFETKTKNFLEELKNNLQLPEALAFQISMEEKSKYMNKKLAVFTEDKMISPDEWDQFVALGKVLGLRCEVDERSVKTLEKFKLFYLIEQGQMPEIKTNINLQKDEVCYFTELVDWYETRSVTKSINYGGLGYNFRIAKGFSYRMGSLNVNKVSSSELTQIDIGDIFVTNKRLIFMGNKKNITIPYSKILDITPYTDGVEVDKETGKNPVIKMEQNNDIFARVLNKALENYFGK